MRREQMIAWAAAGHPGSLIEPFEVNHHDAHGINHLVIREKNRGFNKGPPGQTSHWAVHVCYVTVCGSVIAVDTPDFARTSKPPTCITCLGWASRRVTLSWRG